MISIAKGASSISEYLTNELNLNFEAKETLRYGLEVILGSIIKVIVLGLVSLWLKILPQVILATVTSGGLRALSGGVHCRRYSHCLISGTTIAIAIGELSFKLAPNINLEFLITLTVLTCVAGLLVVRRWAPADNPGKPITKPNKIRKYRNLSMLYVLVWGIVLLSMLCIIETTDFRISISLASILGFWFQAFSITPAGYHLIENIDNVCSKIIH